MNKTEIDELLAACDPFIRVRNINKPFPFANNVPLRNIMPGAWPNYGDLLRLVEAAEKLLSAGGS